MKSFTKAFSVSLFAASFALFLLTGCSKHGGSATAQELEALTNAVRSVTADPIIRIDRLDTEGRMMVSTGSVTNQHDYLFERSQSGWQYIPSVKP